VEGNFFDLVSQITKSFSAIPSVCNERCLNMLTTNSRSLQLVVGKLPLKVMESSVAENTAIKERAVSLTKLRSIRGRRGNFFDLVSQITKSIPAVPQHVQ
jgi:hypothetical protein